MPALAVLVILLMTSGCANETADVRAAYTQTGTLTSEATIGAVDGDPEYLFGLILDILLARDGKVWVLDGSGTMSGPRKIRQFDSEGTFLREVGRRGGGPGEFATPCALVELADGRVVLRDASRPDHLLVYFADGSPDTTWVFNPPIYGGMTPPYALLADRNGLLWVSHSGGGLVRVNGRYERTIGVPSYFRLGSTGAVLDIVLAPQLPILPKELVSVTWRLPNGGRATRGFATPYQPAYVRGWSPEGYFATGRTDAYRIELWNVRLAGEEHPDASEWTTGDPVRVIGRRVPSVRVSKEERDDRRRHLQQQVDQLPGTPSGPVSEVSSVKPYFRWIFFGQEGRMWVWVYMPSERIEPTPGEIDEGTQALAWREPFAFDVFEADGTFLGRVVLPREVYPNPTTMRARRDLVWCVIVDDSGAQMVRRYRVTWP